jgi:hypothetical protein
VKVAGAGGRNALAEAFARRGMWEHRRLLLGAQWSREWELEWMRFLQVPPHEVDYPVLPRGAACPRCGELSANRTATGTFVPVSFPGGWAERCVGCGATWVHVERR